MNSERTIECDPKNADMAAAWDGPEGDRWTADAERYEATCVRFDPWLFAGANIEDGDTVLDVGCGCGISTHEAARLAGKGSALGIDLSTRMLARARERARLLGVTNARFERGDAQVFPFPAAAFDVVISRFGCMFFGDVEAAFKNLARAMRSGGRLVLLTWRSLSDNAWVRLIRDALALGRTLPARPPGTPGPFGMAEADRVRDVLQRSGFDAIELTPVDEPVVLGRDVESALAYVRTMGLALPLLDGLAEDKQRVALEELSRALARHATPEAVQPMGGAWRVTARRPS
jgi:SAM-dependent methyltransferase